MKIGTYEPICDTQPLHAVCLELDSTLTTLRTKRFIYEKLSLELKALKKTIRFFEEKLEGHERLAPKRKRK